MKAVMQVRNVAWVGSLIPQNFRLSENNFLKNFRHKMKNLKLKTVI